MKKLKLLTLDVFKHSKIIIMRIPTVIIIFIAACAYYSLSIIVGFGSFAALYHNNYDLNTGCLKNSSEHSNTPCEKLICYGDVFALIGACGPIGVAILSVIILFVSFFVAIAEHYKCITQKYEGGVIIDGNYTIINCCCCNNAIECDHDDLCCLSVKYT